MLIFLGRDFPAIAFRVGREPTQLRSMPESASVGATERTKPEVMNVAAVIKLMAPFCEVG